MMMVRSEPEPTNWPPRPSWGKPFDLGQNPGQKPRETFEMTCLFCRGRSASELQACSTSDQCVAAYDRSIIVSRLSGRRAGLSGRSGCALAWNIATVASIGSCTQTSRSSANKKQTVDGSPRCRIDLGSLHTEVPSADAR